MKYNAIIRFLSKDEGGRITPPVNGYKSHIKINDKHTSCIITLVDDSEDVMPFGKDLNVYIELQYDNIFSHAMNNRINIDFIRT